MKRFALVVLVVALIGNVLAAQDLERLFKAAVNTETVDRDCKAAIERYKKVASGSNRPLAAQALLRMAGCYQRLGDAEAQQVYERIINTFGDQKDVVAVARARMASASTRSESVVARRIWISPKADADGAVSLDGHFLTFFDPDTGNLGLHNLSSNEDRLLTQKPKGDTGEYGQRSVFAPDGKQVAYSWLGARVQLRVTAASPSAGATERVLYSNPDVEWIAPYDWSRDGKWIAVALARADRTAQIGLVAAGDGSLHVLRSIDWRGPTRMAFSPDGKYLAFDTPADPPQGNRDVFVLAVDGSRQTPATVSESDDLVVGWANDDTLLISSDRSGKTAVYAVPFANGKVSRDVRLLISDLGQAAVLGLSRTGALFYGVRNGHRDVYTATADVDSGRLLTPAALAAERFMGTNYQPDWSFDGRQLSYQSYGGPRGLPHLASRTLSTRDTREIWPALNYMGFPRWSADGRFIFAQGRDLKGRQGVYRINAQTGETEPVVVSTPGSVSLFGVPSPDGKRLYYLRGADNRRDTPKTLIEHDLASAEERELLRSRCAGSMSISRDGASLACIAEDAVLKEPTLVVVPLAGGMPKEVLRFKSDDRNSLRFVDWTADGKSLVFGKHGEVWAIAAAGGQPRKIDLSQPNVEDVRIHPDGKQLAFVTGATPRREVWVAENFLPGGK